MSFVMVTFTTPQQLLKFFSLMLIITVKNICFHILEVLFCDSPLILFYWTASVPRPSHDDGGMNMAIFLEYVVRVDRPNQTSDGETIRNTRSI